MVEAAVTVVNPLGVHARPAAKIVKLANRFESSITLHRLEGGSADARSMLEIMSLAASLGTVLVIKAEGPDEGKALKALFRLLESGFDEV
jgi:phosphocarrier protein HPr